MSFGKKIRELHNYVQSSYYLSYPNLSIGGDEFNDVIIFSAITGINAGKELLVGNYGLGKTTVAEVVSSIIYGYPPEIVQLCELNGHPYLTEEKIFGRPDLASLQKGKEEVVWSNFSIFEGPKIVDEINRIPGGAQNTLLNSIDRGIFKYLNGVLYQSDLPFFATTNYPDSGNMPLIPPLLDRFDISVEVLPPIGLTMYKETVETNRGILECDDITKRMLKYFDGNEDHGDINNLRDEYRDFLKDNGIPTFTNKEIEKIRKDIEKIKISPQSMLFVDIFYSGVNHTIKIKGESRSNHYENSIWGAPENNLSYRFLNSLINYSKSMAFFEGKREVDLTLIKAVLPYVIQHRTEFNGTMKQLDKDVFYLGSQQRYLARIFAEGTIKDFLENEELYEEFYSELMKENEEKITKIGNKLDVPPIRSISYQRVHKG